jgi:maltose alpha-D-glucosyltransferase/alpha-amylase
MIDREYPGRIMLAEANQWAQDVVHYFGDGDEFHMCFHFPVMPRLYMAVAKADRTSVVDILNETPPIPTGCQWATFLRNHDELTLEMVTEEERQFMWNFYSPETRQRLNLGIRRRLAPLMDNDRRRIELMHSMLFTLPGTPVLYYGDEIGMGDNTALFDRNGVRTPMQWDDGDNGGFSISTPENLYAPPITGPDFGYGHVNVSVQEITPNSLLQTIRNMIYMRKQLPVLGLGELIWIDELPKETLCFWRVSDSARILALHNLSDEEVAIPLPDEHFSTALGVGAKSRAETGRPTLALPPYGYHWLVANSP